ncbi:MAG TPA: LuxR C-terminal-related transcriptional regulator [Solirubrobacteraceae bacterium]|nr:LuxR C-terminal-related transcriptional regulator [Solirubrobacteraceae bacterium]
MSDRVSATASPATRHWPLVGRDAEWELIASARADPACPGVVISGMAGVGRSRLAREVCADADRAGELTYWAQATTSSAAIPLGAFAALIPDDVRSDDPLELIRRSTERIRTRAAGRPVCAGVDDAHLLDPASAALVLHLATAAGVFVIATIRAGVTAPDAIDSLWKDGGARRIELRPLSDDALEALVDAALDGPVEQSVVRRVVDGSAGNALYARELIVGALEEGRLTFERGLWRLRRQAVSPSLAALVTRRMGALDDAERAPLELLALGEPLRLSEIAALANLDILQELEARGMVTVDPGAPDAVVRLAQPLYGEVLRAGLPELRARAVRVRLADAVGRRVPLTPDDALRVARWRRDAGGEVPPELLLDAARAANLAGDPEFAAQLAQQACDAGLGLAATLLLARAHIIGNRFADAEAVLSAAEDDAPGDPVALGYIAQRVHVLFWGLGVPEQARAFVERAANWSSDPDWPRRLDPWRLVLSGFVEGVDGYGDDVDETARRLADPSLDARARRQAELAHIFRLMAVGRVKQAYALVRANRPDVPLRDNYDASTLGLLCIIGLEAGEDWAALEPYMTGVLREGVRAGDHQAAGTAAFTLGAMAMARGRYRDAERWLAEAGGQFGRQDAFGTAFSVQALDVGIAFFTGDPARARAALATVHATLGDGDPLPTQVGYLARAEGWGARALSDSTGAEVFTAAAAASDQPNLASRLLYEALRAGAPPKAIAAEQRRLADCCDARLVAAYAAHATALAAHDGQALLAVADEMTTIGADAYAMEAAVDAARQFLGDGREDSARRAAARARELYAEGQGAAFPVIDGLDAVATELTKREAQIAALAARGLSNQEIAYQLVLSVRTVETYVYRAMQKRGVSNRTGL